MSKKVLIVTYYWPPSGGGGVQRWLKFVKYLPEYGWEPVIITPENPDFEIQDSTLLKDIPKEATVLKVPIWEPFGVYRKLMGKKAVQKQGVVKKEGASFMQKAVTWVRGNLFIPDPRVSWVKPTTRYLLNYLKENPVDVIVTTGPPHSMHLIGRNLKRKTGIPWLADFRDPWSEWDVLPQLRMSKRSWEKHKRLEFEVLNMANQVVTVSNRLAKALDKLAGVPGVAVITNGFDAEDFSQEELIKPDKFRIVHMGLLNEGRNPKYLWSALDHLCRTNPDFASQLEVVLAGTIEQGVIDNIQSFSALSSKVKVLDYVSHQEALAVYQEAAVLLLLVNNTSNSSWILPGKLYEYFSARRPILSFGLKQSDANDMVTDCGYDSFLSYNDKKGAKDAIVRLFNNFSQGNVQVASDQIDQYSRKKLTEKLSSLLNDLVVG